MVIEISNTERKKVLHLISKEVKRAEKSDGISVRRLTALYNLEKKFKAASG